jgi:hypothetical protein
MDLTSIVGALLSVQSGSLQTRVAVDLLKSDLDAEQSAVQELLGVGGPNGSPGNLAAGIGGNLDITA